MHARRGKPAIFAVAMLAVHLSSIAANPLLDSGVRWNAPAVVKLPMKLRYGVPAVPCTVNEQKVWIILDTGCQISLLSSETAARLGVRASDTNAPTATLSGSHGNEKAGLAHIRSFAAGPWTCAGLPVLIRQRSADRDASTWFSRPVLIDVLSIQVLRSMCSYVTFDSAANEVELGFGASFQPRSREAEFVELQFRAGLPHADVMVDGARLECLVDTGTSAPLELQADGPAAAHLRVRAGSTAQRRIGIGQPTNRASDVRSGAVSRLELGNVKLLNVEAVSVQDRSKLGFGLLKRFRTTFDFQRSRLWFEKN